MLDLFYSILSMTTTDPAGWFQVALQVTFVIIIGGVQILIGGLTFWFYVFDYRVRKQREDRISRQQEKSLLTAISQELEENWRYLHNPPLFGPDTVYPEYFDPTRQVFKFRDDTVTAALAFRLPDIFLPSVLYDSLLRVSQSVRFVNQQVDELMAFRFGNPTQLARATRHHKDNPKCLEQFSQDPENIPDHLRTFFMELADRHQAIVKEGFWKRLKPSLEAAAEELNKVLRDKELPPLNLPSSASVPPKPQQPGYAGVPYPTPPHLRQPGEQKSLTGVISSGSSFTES